METGSGGEQRDNRGKVRGSQRAGAVRASGRREVRLAARRGDDFLVNDSVGKALQAHYRALADAPLPDRFRALLAELEAKDFNNEK
jgi:hypothetical protein